MAGDTAIRLRDPPSRRSCQLNHCRGSHVYAGAVSFVSRALNQWALRVISRGGTCEKEQVVRESVSMEAEYGEYYEECLCLYCCCCDEQRQRAWKRGHLR